MRQQQLLNEARDLLSQFVTRVKGSTAMGHTDINVISEGFLVELFKEVFQLTQLRNLNRERKNFPGLDLADDTAGIAFQVTATPDLAKIKESLQTIIGAGLQQKYPRIRVYVITEKQASYSQTTIDAVTQGQLSFDASTDVLDYRDVLRECSSLQLDRLERVVGILRKQFLEPNAEGLSASKIYLPVGVETVELNLVQIWFPNTLYVADFVEPTSSTTVSTGRDKRRRRKSNPRTVVSKDIMRRGFDVPEDFEINGNRVVSFHNPADSDSLLRPYVDAGTLTEITPKDYYGVDDDQLSVFKSLLRRAFQRQIRPERIFWQDERHLFFYGLPAINSDDRVIAWKDERAATRTVFHKTMKKNKPDEILTCKHLAFYVNFDLIDNTWYLAITPTWYFSRDGYRPDSFAAKRISWLKGQENDQQVDTHFRFICHRIRELQEASLFDGELRTNLIQIGNPASFSNHPYLPDHLWKPPGLRKEAGDSESPVQSSLPV